MSTRHQTPTESNGLDIRPATEGELPPKPKGGVRTIRCDCCGRIVYSNPIRVEFPSGAVWIVGEVCARSGLEDPDGEGEE